MTVRFVAHELRVLDLHSNNINSPSPHTKKSISFLTSNMRPFFEDHHIRRPLLSLPDEEPLIVRWRRSARDFLNSRWGHYLVLLLVTIDVCCSFSEFLIQLHVCELKQNGYKVGHEWAVIEETLGIAGLVISCLFMVELIVSTLSFGMG